MQAPLSLARREPGQRIAQKRAVIAIKQTLEMRRHRIVLSQATIAPLQWLVILLLDVLILLTIAPATTGHQFNRLFTAVACCLVLLSAQHRTTGGITIQPNVRDVCVD